MRPAFDETLARDDQRRYPLSPSETAGAESLDVDQVQKIPAHSLPHQRTILSWHDPLKLESAKLEMVEEPLCDHQVGAVSLH